MPSPSMRPTTSSAKRIDAGNTRLTPAEWKSGATMRIIDVVAPFGGEAEMRAQIKGT